MKKAIHSQLQPLMNDKASRMAGINVVADKRRKSQVGIRFPESGREFDFNKVTPCLPLLPGGIWVYPNTSLVTTKTADNKDFGQKIWKSQ